MTARSSVSSAPPYAGWSEEARRRLLSPLRRGVFRTIDAARRQLALLAVSDPDGQARIHLLLELPRQAIVDARFLAYGHLTSHPVADALCDLARGRTLQELCDLGRDELEACLSDGAPSAFGSVDTDPYAFVAPLLARAWDAREGLVVPPPPAEKTVYKRKREQDWDAYDRAWLPLTLMRKIMRMNAVVKSVLRDRLSRPDEPFTIEGLHDDTRVRISLPALAPEERPTALKLIEDAARASLHPAITCEEHSHGQ